MLGPGSAGLIVPGKFLWGAIAADCYDCGNIALLSRSDGLLDELAAELTRAGLGQSLAVELGIGATLGSQVDDWLPLLVADPNTEVIVLVEQHLTDTRAAAAALPQYSPKPIVAYVAGQQLPTAPPTQEAATQIVSQFVTSTPHTSTAAEKLAAYKKLGVPVARYPAQLAELLHQRLK
ncbi:MAG: hypothetical protein HC838_13420 [Spirulinaceae cyanobacterium RM2_2_10]|nr:hypothetical protein [Spirulinaceae cyanobacterium RM2_2_10]